MRIVLDTNVFVSGILLGEDIFSVDLMDGRTITVPLVWYPRLLGAPKMKLKNRGLCAAGLGVHWPDLDEGLSIGGLLRGIPAPNSQENYSRQYGTNLPP